MRLFRLIQVAITLLEALASLKELLQLLQRDDYEGARDFLLTHPQLQEELAKLTPDVKAAMALAGPAMMKLVDRLIPEEKILDALS